MRLALDLDALDAPRRGCPAPRDPERKEDPSQAVRMADAAAAETQTTRALAGRAS